MTKLLSSYFCLLLFIPVGGCSSNVSEPAYRLGRYNFAYEITHGVNTNLVQVFDDGEKTYFQFFELRKLPPPKILAGQKRVFYKKSGNYLLVKGVFKAFKIKSGKRASDVKKIDDEALKPSSKGRHNAD